MSAYPPETYDARDDLKAHYLFEEFMHVLETEEAEKERATDEWFLVHEAEVYYDDVEIPA